MQKFIDEKNMIIEFKFDNPEEASKFVFDTLSFMAENDIKISNVETKEIIKIEKEKAQWHTKR